MMNHCNSFFLRLVICLFCICGFSNAVLHAQVSEGGLPPSFQYPNSLRSAEQPIQIPVNFSVEDLKVVDAWRVSLGAPLAIAKLIPTDLGITNAGQWVTLPDGQKVWQLHLKAKGAIALILYYSDFYIPEGGKLFIYNIDKSQLLGAYTKRTHPENGSFATELIAGDEIILEYVPAPSGEEPSIRISDVGYGYNHLYIKPLTKSSNEELSGPCMVNINCEEGEDWQLQKKGVCQMIMPIANSESVYICSGSLVNNTAKDKKPYILSAFHCSQTSDNKGEVSDEDLKKWIFVFHLAHVGCDNNSPLYDRKTMVGCTRKTAVPISGGSDGLLLLLNKEIPTDYNVFYNGWDRTNTLSSSGVGIHHPSGDFMKISTYGKYSPTSIRWTNTDTNQIGANNAHWYVVFDETSNGHGVTEGGSSGSPLFNSNGLIIGTLSGGNSSCTEPNGANLYGKLFFHWDKFSNKENQRMDAWLDPLKTGVTSLAGMEQSGREVETGLKAPKELTAKKMATGEVFLTWKAPLYKQVIGWGDQSIVYQTGFEGKPFYYGQKWDTNDLKPIDKKTITAINFTPIANTTYALFIKQGNRIYEEILTGLTPWELNAVNLKEPFVVNANEELLVSVQVKSYNQKDYPAFTDQGPAVDGKGNILSMNGKIWETLPTKELDANFVISFTVTSENGELTNSASVLRSQPQTMKPMENIKMRIKKSELASLAQDGFLITAFPELTGYQVYRDQTKLATLPASTTEFTDKEGGTNSPIYQVTSLYNDKESEPAIAQVEINVANEQIAQEAEVNIQPSLFSDQVNILNNQQVKLLEIFTANGKLVRKEQHPESSINTGSLPQGVYFFRLTTDSKTKTVQGIKK